MGEVSSVSVVPSLPPQWREATDCTTRRVYYWNVETNITQYHRPPPLSPPPLPSPITQLTPNPSSPNQISRFHQSMDILRGKRENLHHSMETLRQDQTSLQEKISAQLSLLEDTVLAFLHHQQPTTAAAAPTFTSSYYPISSNPQPYASDSYHGVNPTITHSTTPNPASIYPNPHSQSMVEPQFPSFQPPYDMAPSIPIFQSPSVPTFVPQPQFLDPNPTDTFTIYPQSQSEYDVNPINPSIPTVQSPSFGISTPSTPTAGTASIPSFRSTPAQPMSGSSPSIDDQTHFDGTPKPSSPPSLSEEPKPQEESHFKVVVSDLVDSLDDAIDSYMELGSQDNTDVAIEEENVDENDEAEPLVPNLLPMSDFEPDEMSNVDCSLATSENLVKVEPAESVCEQTKVFKGFMSKIKVKEKENTDGVIDTVWPCLDTVLGSVPVDKYSKCGCMGTCRALFDAIPKRDVFVLTALLVGKPVPEMPMRPDSSVLDLLLNACRVHGAVGSGKDFITGEFPMLVLINGAYSAVLVLDNFNYRSMVSWVLKPTPLSVTWNSTIVTAITNAADMLDSYEKTKTAMKHHCPHVSQVSTALIDISAANDLTFGFSFGINCEVIGFTMGIQGTAVVKESSNIVVLVDNFAYVYLIHDVPIISGSTLLAFGGFMANVVVKLGTENWVYKIYELMGCIDSLPLEQFDCKSIKRWDDRGMEHSFGIQSGFQHYDSLVDSLDRARVHAAEKVMTELLMEQSSFVVGALLSDCRVHGYPALGKEMVECFNGQMVITRQPFDEMPKKRIYLDMLRKCSSPYLVTFEYPLQVFESSLYGDDDPNVHNIRTMMASEVIDVAGDMCSLFLTDLEACTRFIENKLFTHGRRFVEPLWGEVFCGERNAFEEGELSLNTYHLFEHPHKSVIVSNFLQLFFDEEISQLGPPLITFVHRLTAPLPLDVIIGSLSTVLGIREENGSLEGSSSEEVCWKYLDTLQLARKADPNCSRAIGVVEVVQTLGITDSSIGAHSHLLGKTISYGEKGEAVYGFNLKESCLVSNYRSISVITYGTTFHFLFIGLIIGDDLVCWGRSLDIADQISVAYLAWALMDLTFSDAGRQFHERRFKSCDHGVIFWEFLVKPNIDIIHHVAAIPFTRAVASQELDILLVAHFTDFDVPKSIGPTMVEELLHESKQVVPNCLINFAEDSLSSGRGHSQIYGSRNLEDLTFVHSLCISAPMRMLHPQEKSSGALLLILLSRMIHFQAKSNSQVSTHLVGDRFVSIVPQIDTELHTIVGVFNGECEVGDVTAPGCFTILPQLATRECPLHFSNVAASAGKEAENEIKVLQIDLRIIQVQGEVTELLPSDATKHNLEPMPTYWLFTAIYVMADWMVEQDAGPGMNKAMHGSALISSEDLWAHFIVSILTCLRPEDMPCFKGGGVVRTSPIILGLLCYIYVLSWVSVVSYLNGLSGHMVNGHVGLDVERTI